MKTLNFFNVKGGCGKSSLTKVTATFLVELGHKVLLLDLDPQRSLTKSCLPNHSGNTIFELLLESCSLPDCLKLIQENGHLAIVLPSQWRFLGWLRRG